MENKVDYLGLNIHKTSELVAAYFFLNAISEYTAQQWKKQTKLPLYSLMG